MWQTLRTSSWWWVLLALTCAVLLTRALLHSPAAAGMTGRAMLAAAIALAYLVFCTLVWLRHRRLRQAQEQRWAESALPAGAGMSLPSAAETQVLVGFASQTGFAEQLALQTAQSLRAGGLQVRVLPLGRISEQDLAAASRALFLVSTTGEGDAPDSAAGFARRMADGAAAASLSQLRFGILALGDRSYAQYCAFAHALEGWLRRSHAQALFDTVEVDNGEAGALRHWQHQLSMLSGHEDADWSVPSYGRWRLAQRRLLNPGSMGGAAFHLALTPLDLPAPQWQAGDVVEIGPRHAQAAIVQWLSTSGVPEGAVIVADGRTLPLSVALQDRQLPDDVATLRSLSAQQLWHKLEPLPHREYSIASLPEDGTLDLLVRQMTRPDGRLGIGSGWLTQHAQVGAEIALRVRINSSFHAPSADIPLILIGNGTGLAGLRAHLRARALAGRQRNWLLFGERSQASDYLHGDEIRAWLNNGQLQRLDLAFSRDQAERVYVQDKLRAAADELRRWVDDGAAIYVCGSLQGMAAGVAAVLTELLGEARLIELAEQGRYRRDVY
jgi:sulfite reductase (NADPH) flavoprotein alpha-component